MTKWLLRLSIGLATGLAAVLATGCLSPGGACDSVACDPGEMCQLGTDGLARCVPVTDPCDSVTCPANAHCELPPDSLLATCACDAGFTPSGDRLSCVMGDGCSLTCTIYGPAHCEEPTPGDERCVCNAGFASNPQGSLCVPRGTCDGIDCGTFPSTHCELDADGAPICACDPGTMPNADASACVPVGSDPCTGVTCSGHGVCGLAGGVPRCACDAGYVPSGDGLSCVTSDPCAGITCSGHGTCAVVGGSARCLCDTGYVPSGTSCVPMSDPCAGVTCSGVGTCTVVGGAPRCNCPSGYQPSGDGRQCLPVSTEGYLYVNAGSGPWYSGDAVYLWVDGTMIGRFDGGMTYFSIGTTGCSQTAPSCASVMAEYTSDVRWCRSILRLTPGLHTITAMLNRGGPDYAHWTYSVNVSAGTCAYRAINWSERTAETGIVRGTVQDSTSRRLSNFRVSSDDGPNMITGSDGYFQLTVAAGRRTITADGPNGNMSLMLDVFPGSTNDRTFIFFPL